MRIQQKITNNLFLLRPFYLQVKYKYILYKNILFSFFNFVKREVKEKNKLALILCYLIL
jgi:hypothetical protein